MRERVSWEEKMGMNKMGAQKLYYVRGWTLEDISSAGVTKLWKHDFDRYPKQKQYEIKSQGIKILDPDNPPQRILFNVSNLENRTHLFSGESLYKLGKICLEDSGMMAEDINGLRHATKEDFYKEVIPHIPTNREIDQSIMSKEYGDVLLASMFDETGKTSDRIQKEIQRVKENAAEVRESYYEGKILKSLRYHKDKRNDSVCTLPVKSFKAARGFKLDYVPKAVAGLLFSLPDVSKIKKGKEFILLSEGSKIFEGNEAKDYLKKHDPIHYHIFNEAIKGLALDR